MRKFWALAATVALGLPGFGSNGVTPKEESSVPKSTASAPKSTPSNAAATTTAKKPTSRITRPNRQFTPTPERYKQIEEALCRRGYLSSDQVNGQWNDRSAAALKKFQTDQNLVASGKIDSLSLIALGLGPKHQTTSLQSPVASQPGNP
jgi:Putative peptidoglycan binding domain